jgi:hypothetical protein
MLQITLNMQCLNTVNNNNNNKDYEKRKLEQWQTNIIIVF